MIRKIIQYIRNIFSRDDVCLFIGSTDILPPPLKKKKS